MKATTTLIHQYRRELRAAMGDKSKLSKLHSTVTESINQAYGEEKEELSHFRQELRDAMNSGVRNLGY
jgi:hypothetical protein